MPVIDSGTERAAPESRTIRIGAISPGLLAAEAALTDPQPVSAALDLRSELLRVPAERALAAIDRVHLAAGLPRIPLDTRRDDPLFRGHYRIKRNSGQALGIGIDPDDPALEFIIVHELGHFLDHQGLGRPGSWASLRLDELRAWRQAVDATPSIKRLRGLLALSDTELARRTGEATIVRQRARARYLLAYTEAWARSYAQYIAIRAGEGLLLDQLAAERISGGVIGSLGQWSDEEFLSVAATIDDVLSRRGWMR